MDFPLLRAVLVSICILNFLSSIMKKFLLCNNYDSFIIFPIQDVRIITQKNCFLSVPCRRLHVSCVAELRSYFFVLAASSA